MLENYLPILIFLAVAAALGILLLALGFLLGKGEKSDAKLSPYECGFDEFEDARIPFDVRYYLVAILFIIFDLEIVLYFSSPGCVCILTNKNLNALRSNVPFSCVTLARIDIICSLTSGICT